MISPERLRKYPFFGSFSSDELAALSMLADETAYPKVASIFQAETSAKTFFVLEKGCVELYYESYDPVFSPQLRRQFLVGEINPGEVFGISSLVEPYQWSATAIAATPCQVIEINAEKVQTLFDDYPGLEQAIYKQILPALMERLHYTRVQLAAARTD
ncbi:MAG: cyclic nucleotide-binding domain-containing protein [Anaerolineales bacterium]|nr:cyclic nucleotide-binding domain-containing protein [Anaerolineales bacterium]